MNPMGSARPRCRTHGLSRAAIVLPAVLSLVLAPVATGLASAGVSALPPPVPCNASAGPCWQPNIHARWQYQLQGSPDGHGGGPFQKKRVLNKRGARRTVAGGRPGGPAAVDNRNPPGREGAPPPDYAGLKYAGPQ